MPVERLKEVGPIDPDTGFPLWYKDGNDVRLELVWQRGDQFAPALGDPEGDAPLKNLPAFPDESFYMLAEAELVAGGTGQNGRVRVVLALEATFGGNEAITDGQQIVFGRIRFRIDDAVPEATYTLTHPYGTVAGKADDRGRVFETQDIGVSPLAFEDALGAQVAPFLTWTPDPNLPAGYIGDGNTAHTIMGSPFGTNFARVEGPNIADAGERRDPADPTNINKIYTDLFVLQGKLATRAGVDVPRAVYSRDAAGSVTLDVFARSEPGQNLVLSGPGVADTALQGGAQGNYFLRIPGDASTLSGVTVTNQTDVPASVKPATVTDAVEITTAEYNRAAGELTVTAASSDAQIAPLTIEGRGLPAGAAPGTPIPLDAPPHAVTVRSAAGAVATRAVSITA